MADFGVDNQLDFSSVGGISRFKQRFFEQNPAHFRPGFSKEIIGDTDIQNLVRRTAAVNPQWVRANRAGNVLTPPLADNSASVVDWAVGCYESGATIILNYVDEIDDNLHNLAVSLGADFAAEVTFTLFATPPNSQGFSPHFDTLDVFVFQVEGRKLWSLSAAAVKLPTMRQGYLVQLNTEEGHQPNSIELVPEDVLYIPRGIVHWAMSGSEKSVHLTADVNTCTLGDLCRAALTFPQLFRPKDELEELLDEAIFTAGVPDAIRIHTLMNYLSEPSDFTKLLHRGRKWKWSSRKK